MAGAGLLLLALLPLKATAQQADTIRAQVSERDATVPVWTVINDPAALPPLWIKLAPINYEENIDFLFSAGMGLDFLFMKRKLMLNAEAYAPVWDPSDDSYPEDDDRLFRAYERQWRWSGGASIRLYNSTRTKSKLFEERPGEEYLAQHPEEYFTFTYPSFRRDRSLFLRLGATHANYTVFGLGDSEPVLSTDGAATIQQYAVNVSATSYYIGLSHYWTSYLELGSAGGTLTHKGLKYLYADLLFCPQPDIDDFHYQGYTFDLRQQDHISVSNLGFRVGYNSIAGKARRHGFYTRAEAGLRPGITDEAWYVSLGIGYAWLRGSSKP